MSTPPWLLSHSSCADALGPGRYLLRFHTMRRMSPGAKSYGVSIASQRRFLGYFARLLEHNDPRSPLSLSSPPLSPRRILLESITIVGPGLAGAGKVLSGGKDKLSVQIFRYKDDIAAELRRHELQLAEAGRPTPFDDEEWDDRSDMFFRVGGFVEGPSSKSPSAPTAEASAPTAAAPSVPTLPASISSSVSASTSSLPSIIDADASSSTDSVASLPPVSNTAVTASQSASSSRPSRSRTLVPYASFVPPAANPLEVVNPPRRSEKEAQAVAKAEVGIVLDGDREVQLRFLVGETGKKHGKLPAMVRFSLSLFSRLLTFFFAGFPRHFLVHPRLRVAAFARRACYPCPQGKRARLLEALRRHRGSDRSLEVAALKSPLFLFFLLTLPPRPRCRCTSFRILQTDPRFLSSLFRRRSRFETCSIPLLWTNNAVLRSHLTPAVSPSATSSTSPKLAFLPPHLSSSPSASSGSASLPLTRTPPLERIPPPPPIENRTTSRAMRLDRLPPLPTEGKRGVRRFANGGQMA